MIKMMDKRVKNIFFIASILLSLHVIAEDYETYPVINSNQILSSEYLSSTYHRIDSIDIQDGFYKFSVESNIGRYDISSLSLLKKRVDEIKILSRALDQYAQQNNEFSGELRSQLSVSGESAVDIITSPFSTASKLANQLANNLDATLAGEDPFVRDTANRYSLAEPRDPTTALHKRNIAFQLGLDMYSTNYNVQAFLNKVANARNSGRISAGVSFNNAYNSLAKYNEIDLQIAHLLKNKSLIELRNYILESLLKLGIKRDLVQAFGENAILSPTHKVTIVTYLNELNNVARLGAYIALAAMADNEVSALIAVQLSKMLLQYDKNVEYLAAFYNYKGRPAAITSSKKIVFFELVDLLIWSEDNRNRYLASAEHAKKAGYKSWEVIMSGNLSSEAATNLDKLNYNKQTNFLNQ